jgi:hypothetical protein
MACEDVDWINLAKNKGPMIGSWGHSDELPGSIKRRHFLNQLSNYELLKKDSTP